MAQNNEIAESLAKLLEDRETAGMDGQVDGTLAAALELVLDAADSHTPSDAGAAALAALVDGGLHAGDALALLRVPADRARAEAALAFAEACRSLKSGAPAHLLAAARDKLTAGGARIIPLQRPAAGRCPHTQTFALLAAASDGEDQAIVWHSEGGEWSLATYPGISAADKAAHRGTLLLSINPEYGSTYEGLHARIFVSVDGEKRVLAEGDVQGLTVFVHISFQGLDMRSRHALSVEWIDLKTAE